MFETPGAANITLETLANLAAGLKVGLIVKFVPFNEMLRWENSYSQDTFDVLPRLDQDEAFLNPSTPAPIGSGAMAAASFGIGADIFGAAKKKGTATVQGMAGNSIPQPNIAAEMANHRFEQAGAGAGAD